MSLSDYFNQILSNHQIAVDDPVDDTTVEYLIEIVKEMDFDWSTKDSKLEVIQHVLQFIPCLTENDQACLDTIIIFLLENIKAENKFEHVFPSFIDSDEDDDNSNNNNNDNNNDNNKHNYNDNDIDDLDNAENRRYNEDMDFLVGMVPDLDQDLLQFIYEVKFNGIKDDTARYLLEHCINNSDNDEESLAIIKHEKAHYDSKKIKERELEIEEERKLQKGIINRYGERTVLPKYDKYGRYNALKSRPLIMTFSKAPKTKTRYRDNAVASVKGEKFLVEKKPEYDSGSRGKVMPKGKRGPGWVNG